MSVETEEHDEHFDREVAEVWSQRLGRPIQSPLTPACRSNGLPVKPHAAAMLQTTNTPDLQTITPSHRCPRLETQCAQLQKALALKR